ncbi:hypothetical protein NKR23_g2962 [Pleurostoma richardsiae]|uniref:Uncharacterized protein n=1 Tax=Pleurostoma richardsiae TaxID=41990 RepID=A0AA38RP83_9PEZI|nr:hypothetical protein NKR23_g2962 [Pleurostoma richardsiae]
MDTSSTVATWLSLAVTTAGLGGLISQASAIIDNLDPFHSTRTVEYLGVWFQRQPKFPWWRLVKPPPDGPVIVANLNEGFCGENVLHLTRLPLRRAGKAGWSVLLSILNPTAPTPRQPATRDLAEKGIVQVAEHLVQDGEDHGPTELEKADWGFLGHQQLVRHQNSACITISRTALIVVMCVTNARKTFQYTDAAGFRAGYASYNGQWYITWPIGQEAVVRFAPHDSHSATTDVYPRSFVQRVDRCVQVLAGIVSARETGGSLHVAFCGRKPAGRYVLEYIVKGFPGAHGSRHLYNMMGGKVYEVDFMYARPLGPAQGGGPFAERVLTLPSTDKGQIVEMILNLKEEEVIKHALDCLPWASLSWSIHRGMKDILTAYAKPVMDTYRQQLASRLQQFVKEHPSLLVERGWNPGFVKESMADMAFSAVLAGSGNSGDLVRVVTEIVLAMVGDWDFSRLDDVTFWRNNERQLDLQGVVALTKLFVLEWSNDFDYQLYHELPISVYFA